MTNGLSSPAQRSKIVRFTLAFGEAVFGAILNILSICGILVWFKKHGFLRNKGVEDGRGIGTILVDLEQHRVIDLLAVKRDYFCIQSNASLEQGATCLERILGWNDCLLVHWECDHMWPGLS